MFQLFECPRSKDGSLQVSYFRTIIDMNGNANRYLSLGILDLVQSKKNTSYINTACCHTKRLPYYVFNAREWNSSINHAQNCHCVSMHLYVWSCITNSTRAFQYLVTRLPINTHTLSVKIGSVQFTEFLPWNTWLHHNIGKSFSVSNKLILWPWLA